MADGILNPIEQLEAEIDFDVYTKQEVDALLDEKADKSDTYTKTETDALLDDKADADSVYTKTETDTLLSAKADKSTTLAGYGITDAYSKTQTDNLLNGKADADSVYTKTEIDTKIPNTVGSATKPTYVNGGVITECTYELNKTVPANAVFTDTTYTAGNGLNLIGTSFSAKAGANVSVDSGGINVNGNGVVASADSGLVSGGTAYTELRPTLDGTWVKNAQTTAINLQKLEGGIEYLYGLLSHQYDQLKKYINGNYYDYDTDTDSKYTKTVPQGAMPYASLDSIGGKTVVWNQLADFSTITNGGAYAFTIGTQIVVGHTYYFSAVYNGTSNYLQFYARSGSNKLVFNGQNKQQALFVAPYGGTSDGTTNNNEGNIWMYVPGSAWTSGDTITNIMLVDLTLLFGAGNEPSTVAEFTAQFPAQYYPYNAGQLLSAGVTSVVSKKADTTEIATYPIPAEVQALEGYGLGINKYNNQGGGYVQNEIDFERKVYIQRLAKVTITSADIPAEDSGNIGTITLSSAYGVYAGTTAVWIRNFKQIYQTIVDGGYAGMTAKFPLDLCERGLASSQYRTAFFGVSSRADLIALIGDGLDMYYELETPIETDISAYLTDDNLIEVESGGTLTFPNQNGDDYRIPVPSTEEYMINLQEAVSNG